MRPLNKAHLISLSALCLVWNPLAIADDTEIYLSTGVDILDESVRPNVMFLMDTSGSMGERIAVEVPSEDEGFAYNPSTDYGESDDNLIYVYNTDYEFQNITLTYTQSVCEDMEDYFDDNPSFPIYSDRALQWQSNVSTETIEESELICEDVEVDSSEITEYENGRVDEREWDYYGPYDVAAGTDFVVTGTTDNRNDEIRLYVRLGNWPSSNSYDCRRNKIENESETCTVSVGGSDTQGYIAVRGREDRSDYDLEITYGGSGTVEVCEEEISYTDVEVTEANWTDALQTTNDSGWVLECQDDSNEHGIDGSTNLDRVLNCGTNDCTEPSYTSSRNSEINWSGVETRTFMTANYHDYVTLFGVPEESSGSLPSGNSNSTCNSQSSGYKFTDDGITYECVEKLELMKSSANQLIASLDSMNLGLARLNSNSNGGYVLEKIRNISDEYSEGVSVKTAYTETVDDLPASGGTPLTESLWEMMLYLQGETPFYGTMSGTNTDSEAIDGGKYVSPIINSCQSNNVILLTDGEPTNDSGADSGVRYYTGSNCSSSNYATTASGTCLDELAEYMASTDLSDGPSGVSGTQTARVYTIGFDIDLPLLQTTADKGQGQYFTVSNAFELSSAFTSILVDILAESSTFVAPAISVNAFNQLQHRNEIYFAVFKPNNSPRWTGNVKKFTVASNGTILDANGVPAIDPTTGFFADTARDYWSDTIDGNEVDAGGFRDEMPDNRRVFTYFGDSPSEVNLTSGGGAYQFSTSNTSITRELLGLEEDASTTTRNNLILWGSGEDLFDDDGDNQTNDANHFVGDALHSRPFLVTYGGTEADPYDILYVGTNMGFLHAIDGASGEELWSFIPDDLIKNIKSFQEGNANESKVYGLDGEISLWVNESIQDSDQNIETADGDFVNLYVGMRRGGRDYYAFDVSNYNPNNLSGIYPILKWKINGGEGDYEDLGQSWSRMIKAAVDWNCSDGECDTRDVLFFTGGYDTVHDDATSTTTGDLGNTLYMIDADTGELMWSAGNNSDSRSQRVHNLGLSEMQNSIPGSPNIVDVDADGSADVIFVTDIVGKVFRFDLSDETTNASNFATGGQIFELNEGADFKRFYNQPDVVLTGDRGADAYFNLIFGSGYMASPRDEEQSDAIYVLFEDDVFSAPTDDEGQVVYQLNSLSELYDARAGNAAPANKYDNAPYGYYVAMTGNGEKMLRPGLIFQDTITYTSYVPDGTTNTESCSGGLLGGSRLYRIDLATGTNLLTREEVGLEGEGATPDYIELVRPGIAPEGTIIFLEDGAVLCIATECTSAGDNRQVERVYWREEEPNDDS